MPYLHELGMFLWAVLNNWAGYATGGLIVALLSLWSTWFQKPIPKKVGIVVALTFLFFAFFNAWHERYAGEQRAKAEANEKQEKLDQLTKPDFEITWASPVMGEGFVLDKGYKTPFANFYVQMSVLNHGAPSVIKDWKCFIFSPSGEKLEGQLLMGSKQVMHMTVNMRGGAEELPLFPSLIETWSITPIPTGGRGVGSVIFKFPPGTKKKMSGPGGLVVVSIWDIAGREYPVKIPWGKVPLSAPGLQPALPGMTP